MGGWGWGRLPLAVLTCCHPCSLQSQAFFYIHHVMSSDGYSPAEKEEIEKAAVENFEVQQTCTIQPEEH